MRLLGKTVLAVVVLLSLAVAILFARLVTGTSPGRYSAWVPERTLQSPPEGAVTATFLGVATVLLDDGETALLTDGFFSRPPIQDVLFGKVAPDRERIAAALGRAGIEDLAAVVVVHSHYDHAMDAPEVALRTGADLVGSESTANVGRGWGLDEDRVRVVSPGEPLRYGSFTVRLFESVHVPLPGFMSPDADGTSVIREPLVPPAEAYDYKLGKAWSVLVEHPSGNTLIQGSAGYVPGLLDDVRADTVFLGTGGLALQTDTYRDEYFRHVVEAVGARRVIPIHWDNFFLPLDRPLQPNLSPGDGFRLEMEHLIAKAMVRPDLTFHFLPAFHPIVLY